MAQPPKKKPRLKSALTKKTNARRINSPSPSPSPPSPPQISSRTPVSSRPQISTASDSTQTNLQSQVPRAQNSAHEESQQQERLERRKKRKYEEFVKEVAAEYEAKSKSYKTLLPYQQIGLYAPRHLTLYWNIAAILNAGLERETMQMKAKTRTLHAPNCEESSDDDESDLDEDDLAERAHLLTIYDKIASTSPSVVQRLLKSVNYDDSGTSYLGLAPELIAYVTVQARFALSSLEGINSNRECFHDIPTTAEAPANDSGLTSLFTESSAPEDDDSKDNDSDNDDSDNDDSNNDDSNNDDSDDDDSDDDSEDDDSEDDDDPQGNVIRGVNELGGGEDNGGQGNRSDGGQGYIGDDDDFDDDGDGSGGNE
ncbi:hypothetical protein FB446DRAFT_791816 [Lentinula raphanica]|nr:hypothetical protein FB446DRAFT_791816 [Lentinula raphanica]